MTRSIMRLIKSRFRQDRNEGGPRELQIGRQNVKGRVYNLLSFTSTIVNSGYQPAPPESELSFMLPDTVDRHTTATISHIGHPDLKGGEDARWRGTSPSTARIRLDRSKSPMGKSDGDASKPEMWRSWYECAMPAVSTNMQRFIQGSTSGLVAALDTPGVAMRTSTTNPGHTVLGRWPPPRRADGPDGSHSAGCFSTATRAGARW
jgi:hypothetical protein